MVLASPPSFSFMAYKSLYAACGMMPQEDGFTTTALPSPCKGAVNSASSFLGHASLHPCFAEEEEEEDRAASALRIHSQAEKRRRERINARLSTLRRMIPEANKMDKASLLGKVIEQVKDLKRKAVDISKGFTIPSETNEVTVESKGGCEITYIEASICCDDRPDLLADLIQAFQGLRVTAVRADMISLGGRVRNVFVLCKKDSQQGSVCMTSLEDSIKEVLARIASSDVVSGKRQRLMQSQYSNISF